MTNDKCTVQSIPTYFTALRIPALSPGTPAFFVTTLASIFLSAIQPNFYGKLASDSSCDVSIGAEKSPTFQKIMTIFISPLEKKIQKLLMSICAYWYGAVVWGRFLPVKCRDITTFQELVTILTAFLQLQCLFFIICTCICFLCVFYYRLHFCCPKRRNKVHKVTQKVSFEYTFRVRKSVPGCQPI